MHVDHHVVWPNPNDRNHIVLGNDGGLYESWDEGKTWRHFTNLPVTQFYRVSVDNMLPFYNVCGGSQDNGSDVRSASHAAQRRHPHERLVSRRRRRRLQDAQRSGRSEHHLCDVAERRVQRLDLADRPVVGHSPARRRSRRGTAPAVAAAARRR